MARDRIYIAGGIDGYGECRDTVWSFDPLTSRWRSHQPLKRPRAQLGMAALNGQLVASHVPGACASSPWCMSCPWLPCAFTSSRTHA